MWLLGYPFEALDNNLTDNLAFGEDGSLEGGGSWPEHSVYFCSQSLSCHRWSHRRFLPRLRSSTRAKQFNSSSVVPPVEVMIRTPGLSPATSLNTFPANPPLWFRICPERRC